MLFQVKWWTCLESLEKPEALYSSTVVADTHVYKLYDVKTKKSREIELNRKNPKVRPCHCVSSGGATYTEVVESPAIMQ